MHICKINGCDKKVYALKLCQKHYTRLLRYGSPYFCKNNGDFTNHPREYSSYRAMKNRCLNKKHKQYKDYGGRGIKICRIWADKNGFSAFLRGMGERPVGCSLDRIDNDGDYCPENCKWSTAKEQAANKRTLIIQRYKGKTEKI